MHGHDEILAGCSSAIFQVQTQAPGPAGRLPLTEELLLNEPSGNLFGLSHNVGMGWDPKEAAGKSFLVLSTQGGVRAPDGKPIALGYHTGHWEIGLLVRAAAEELRQLVAERERQNAALPDSALNEEPPQTGKP